MKLYTFYAKANPSFLKALKTELKFIGLNRVHDLTKDKLSYLRFRAELPDAWRIMLYSRLIEHLKIEVADDLRVRYI
jgi:hypothetical protein